MKYALATANPGKIDEMRVVLFDLGFQIVTRDELGINVEIEETGTTFFENARLKAEAICRLSKMPSIADDSGLLVDALGDKPGVYSSSFGGEDLSAAERCAYLLAEMKDFPEMEQRRAKFVCTIICAFPDNVLLTATGECPGVITMEPRGKNGFGYDPVFLPDGMDKTMAQLTSGEKNAISHRGKALREFSKLLKSRKAGMNV